MSARKTFVRSRHFYFIELTNHSASSRNARLYHKTSLNLVQLVTSQVVSSFHFFSVLEKFKTNLLKFIQKLSFHLEQFFFLRNAYFADHLARVARSMTRKWPKMTRHFNICRSYERLQRPFPALFSGRKQAALSFFLVWKRFATEAWLAQVSKVVNNVNNSRQFC